MTRQKTPDVKPNQIYLVLLFGILILATGFIIGWLVKSFFPKVLGSDLKPLRLDGYKYISPLLACDTENGEKDPQLQPLRDSLSTLIDNQKEKKQLDSASVYFRDLATGSSFNINEEEKYFPASLSKVPVMMTYLKYAATNPGALDKKLVAEDKTDTNQGSEIDPAQSLTPGKEYSVSEMIDKMITYSDNVAFYTLADSLDSSIFQKTFSDLRVPLRDNPTETLDYMTAYDFSYFLRVLYNATYLTKDNSQKALELLTKTDFKQGLAAGVPKNVEIAHKFGIYTTGDNGTVKNRELHDCGIVYRPGRPYLACVMTKSSGNLQDAEQAIGNISTTIYSAVDKNYK